MTSPSSRRSSWPFPSSDQRFIPSRAKEGDGLPTQGEDAEAELLKYCSQGHGPLPGRFQADCPYCKFIFPKAK